jgi:hypothetical protein
MTAFYFGPIARVDALPRFDRSERQAKVASQRLLAFKSPPMDEDEKRRLADEIRAQKAREYAVVEGELFG